MNISLTNLPKITFRATSNVSNQNMQTAPQNMQSQPVKDTFEKSDKTSEKNSKKVCNNRYFLHKR